MPFGFWCIGLRCRGLPSEQAIRCLLSGMDSTSVDECENAKRAARTIQQF